jgi:hypothetical protein
MNVRTVLTLALGCAAFIGVACGGDVPPNGGSTVACGGITGAQCPSGMFCDFAGGCGQGDVLGNCQPMPTACEQDCVQVCGCDARSYCNACIAHMAGVDEASNMTCDDIPPTSNVP